MNGRLTALSILWLILTNMAFGMLGVGYAESNDPAKELLIREIRVYMDAVTRILDTASNETLLVQEVRDYIASINATDLYSLSVEELEGIRDTLKDYFEALKENLSVDPSIGEEVRRRIMEEVSAVVELIIQKYNASSLGELYSQLRQYIAAGDMDKALAILGELDRVLSEVSIDIQSKELINKILGMLKTFSRDGNVSYVESLNRSIGNIRSAIDVLLEVREYLNSINASEESILAIDLAIFNLNSTVSILENVKTIVGDQVVPGELGKAINSTLTDKVLKEIAEYRRKVSALMNESYRLENMSLAANKSYLLMLIEEARNALTNASEYLNSSEASALAGNLTEAFNYLNNAKALIDHAEDILEDVAKILGTSLIVEEAGQNASLPKLAEKLEDLSEDITELMQKANMLLNNSEVKSDNTSFKLVTQAIAYLENASALLSEAWSEYDAGNFTGAFALYKQAYSLYEAAELNIDLVKEWLEESNNRHVINEIIDKTNDYRKDIEELSSKAQYLYNVAVEKNDSEAAQLILEAQEKLRNASDLLFEISDLIANKAYSDASKLLSQVAMLIADAKQNLIQAANKLNVAWDDLDHGDDGSEDGSAGEDGDSTDDASSSSNNDSNNDDDEDSNSGSNSGGGMTSGGSNRNDNEDEED